MGFQTRFVTDLIRNPSITICSCDELLAEFKAVACRRKIQRNIPAEDINKIIKIMRVYCKWNSISTKAVSDIRDKNDLYLLSLAETTQADYIITGDKDLLVLRKHLKTRILTINEFLSL